MSNSVMVQCSHAAKRSFKAMALAALVTGILAGSASAQGWFPIGATWTYNYADQLFTGYVTHVVTGDSVIDGRTCQVLDVVRTYGNGPNVYTMQFDPYCVYDSAGLSFIHVPGVGFDTLYNMNAQIGDRWLLTASPEQCDNTSYLEVVDTGHVVMDGVSLRWLAVERHFPALSWPAFQDTIVERLGTMSYLPPQNSCLAAVDGSLGGALRCYHDDEVNYMANWVDACEIPLSVADHLSTDNRLRLYPNPGSDMLQLESTGRSTADVLVTDATGRTIARTAMQAGTIKLNTAQWSPGLYQVQVITEEGSVVRKWMKQ